MNGYMIIVLEFVKINQRSGIIGPHIGIFDRLHITVAQIDVCKYICTIELENELKEYKDKIPWTKSYSIADKKVKTVIEILKSMSWNYR